MSSALCAALLVVAGCGPGPGEKPKPVQVTSKQGLLELTVPFGWYENPKEHPFDLQVFSLDRRMNTGAFVYQAVNLAEEMTPTRVFEDHVEDLRSKRKNFREHEGEAKGSAEGMTSRSVFYSGEKAGAKNIYQVSLVEFDEDPSVFVVFLQICVPSDWSEGKSTFEEILRSARRPGKKG
jgi:hypothetical protein